MGMAIYGCVTVSGCCHWKWNYWAYYRKWGTTMNLLVASAPPYKDAKIKIYYYHDWASDKITSTSLFKWQMWKSDLHWQFQLPNDLIWDRWWSPASTHRKIRRHYQFLLTHHYISVSSSWCSCKSMIKVSFRDSYIISHAATYYLLLRWLYEQKAEMKGIVDYRVLQHYRPAFSMVSSSRALNYHSGNQELAR